MENLGFQDLDGFLGSGGTGDLFLLPEVGLLLLRGLHLFLGLLSTCSLRPIMILRSILTSWTSDWSEWRRTPSEETPLSFFKKLMITTSTRIQVNLDKVAKINQYFTLA